MNIVFHCPACNARFEVAPTLAGKQARCKKCASPLTIPRPLAGDGAAVAAGVTAAGPGLAMAAAAALQPAAVAAASRPKARAAAPAAAGRAGSWIDAVTSQVGLAPVSETKLAPIQRPNAPRPAISDTDESLTELYTVREYERSPELKAAGKSTRPAGFLTRAYRSQVWSLASLFRTINESAYLISVPFLIQLGFGILMHNKGLALMGATAVVLLNIGRLVSGVANLAAIPFKDSPIQGILFLIPPFTLIYLLGHWNRLRKPFKRIIEPALTLLAVVLAFTFVPWLRGADAPVGGGLKAKIQAGASTLKGDVMQEVRQLPGALRGGELPGNPDSSPAPGSDGPGPDAGGPAPAGGFGPGPGDAPGPRPRGRR